MTVEAKLAFFTKQGVKLKGVVHVGTNDGCEVPWYLENGLEVLGFEPLKEECQFCKDTWPEGVFINCAIGKSTRRARLEVTRGGTGGSTFLEVIATPKGAVPHQPLRHDVCQMCKVSDIDADWDRYDALVVDVQGMELEVLQSFAQAGILENFKVLNIECSEVPLYKGESPAQDVIEFLGRQGFKAMTPTSQHDDILFARADVL